MATTTYYSVSELAAHHPTAASRWQSLEPFLEVAPGYPVFEVQNGVLLARIEDVDQAQDLFVWAQCDQGIGEWAEAHGGTTACGGLAMQRSELWLLASEDLPAPQDQAGLSKALRDPAVALAWVCSETGKLAVTKIGRPIPLGQPAYRIRYV